jgi:hypothetical protein
MKSESHLTLQVLLMRRYLDEAVRMLLHPLPSWDAVTLEDRRAYVRDCCAGLEAACERFVKQPEDVSTALSHLNVAAPTPVFPER